MAGLFNLRFFLTFLLFLASTRAKYCIPGKVQNISIASDGILHWDSALNPDNCTISAYVLDIFDSEDGSQLQFQISSGVLSYNLSALDMCKTYAFEVHALTDLSVLGPSDRVNATVPPAADLNLTLSINQPAISGNNTQIHLTWNPLHLEVSRCISYYRVVYWDENNSPSDVYARSNNFVLPENAIPCMKYTFQVNAIITNPDEEGPLTETNWDGYTAVTGSPKLVNINADKTSVNMTWRVPTYSENRCNITELVIDTLGLPANSSTKVFPIQDSVLRPNVDITLNGLSPDTVYTSRVSLVNSAGPSKNVTVTFQTSDSFVFSYERDLMY